jgi:PAS domain S-box-containing protein
MRPGIHPTEAIAVSDRDWMEASLRCAQEVLHLSGTVQPFGLLLAVCSEGIIHHAGGLGEDFFGCPAPELIGQSLANVLPKLNWPQVREQLAPGKPPGRVFIGSYRVPQTEAKVEVFAHHQGEKYLLEFVSPGETPEHFDAADALESLLEATQSDISTDQFAQLLTDHLQKQSHYDRVLIYQFDSDNHGHVIAESRAVHVEAYLGLHFPASDIPPQARELYKQNRLRVLVDSYQKPMPIHGGNPTALNLSLALLRPLSPVHCQYMHNMGVRASLVVSILREGRLWGLIACHHSVPYQPSWAVQRLAESLSRLFSQQLALWEQHRREKARQQAQSLLQTLSERLDQGGDLEAGLLDSHLHLMESLDASGLAIVHQGRIAHRGVVPDLESLRALAEWLSQSGQRFFVSSALGHEVPQFASLAPIASGLLALSCGTDESLWLMWFRPEQPETVRWAGDPRKGVDYDLSGPRLSPRASFSLWLEEVRGRAKRWSFLEIALIQEVVRPNLMELMLLASHQRTCKAQRELELMRTAVEAAHDAILITEAEPLEEPGPRILYANPAFLQETGYTLEEVIGRSPRFLQGKATDRASLDQIRDRLRCWEPVTVELRNYRKDGSEFWVELSITPAQRADGWVTHWIAIQRNITQRKQAELALADRETSLRLILQQMPLGCLTVDRELRIRSWNPACEKIFEWTEPEVLGRSALETFVPAEAHGYVEELTKRLQTESGLIEGYNQNLTRSGRLLWCRWHNTALRDTEGNLVGYLSMAQDVTQLHEAQRALHESNRRYETIAQTMTDVISVHRLDAQITFVTPSTQRVTGYTPEEWIRQDALSLIHPDDLPLVLEAHQRNLRGEVTHIEWRCQHRNGAYIWMETIATPTYDESNNVSGIVCCSRDISDRKRGEQARLTLEEQLRQVQKLEAIGQLAGGVAHDFNNLLTVIITCGELLTYSLPDDHPDRVLTQDILRAAERGCSLTRQLLTFSRQQIVQKQVLDLIPLVQNSCKMLSRLIGEDITLQIRLAEEPLTMEADPGQIEQVLMNLIVNARDAMPRGGSLTITCDSLTLAENDPRLPPAYPAGDYVRLCVQDTGEGMTPEVRARLFEPFFTTKPVGRGTGLGLATVHGIVGQAKGFILVESEVSHGTTFEVVFPRVAPPPPNDNITDTPNPPTPTGQRILLVEDDPDVRSLVATILERSGYTVHIANTPEMAVEECEKLNTPMDLLLSDVVMPGMSGGELLEKLRERFPELRVGFISGYTPDTILRHGIEQEAMPFLQKPFTPDALVRFVRETIASK